MNRTSIVIAVAIGLTAAWASQTPAEHKREWVVSSTPAMKGHSQEHPLDVECVPADDDTADPIYLRVNPYHQLNQGDACPLASARP